MSIAKMEKLTVIGLARDREAVIKELMRLGVVEINAPDSKLSDEHFSSVFRKDDGGKQVSKWEAELAKITGALTLLEKYSDARSPLIKTRASVKEKDFKLAMDDEHEIRKKTIKLTKLSRKLNQNASHANAAETTRLALLPWQEYDVPAEDYHTRSTNIWQGVIPATSDPADFLKMLSERTDYASGELVASDSEQHYLSVLYYEPFADEVQTALRDLGFNRITLPLELGSVKEALASLEEEQLSLNEEKEKLIEDVKSYEEFKPLLEQYSDEMTMRRDRAQIRDSLLVSGSTFYLDGWFPRIAKEKLQALLEKRTCWYEMVEPAKDEETPILLLNGGFAQPFEAVTKLYSLPLSTTIDATPFFSFFYALFFGMMLSDAAYGLIITVACLIVRKKYDLEGMLKDLVNMFVYCGISTIVFGLLFGSFFGDVITQVSTSFFHHTVNFPTLFVNPLDKPMTVLFLSCGLGIVHIFLSMAIGGYMSIRDGHPLDAVFDVGFWYMIILGLIAWMGGGMVAGIPAIVVTIGKWSAIIGAVGVLLTGGRAKKGIFGKISGGLGALYGITGYLSDILSYSRLLALGLATSVISSVFNTLGTLSGPTVFGIIIFIVAFCIGHPYNLAINALGSFVHTCRLQYVEFFGRFYQGGGEEYKPFCENTKYVKIIKEDL